MLIEHDRNSLNKQPPSGYTNFLYLLRRVPLILALRPSGGLAPLIPRPSIGPLATGSSQSYTEGGRNKNYTDVAPAVSISNYVLLEKSGMK